MRITKRSKPTAQKMKKYLAQMNITESKYRDWVGLPPNSRLMSFFIDNPRWTFKDWADLLKENKGVIRKPGSIKIPKHRHMWYNGTKKERGKPEVDIQVCYICHYEEERNE
jgi:hypothetical protein